MPRRDYGSGSISQLADGTFRGRIDLGIDPVTGKRQRKYFRGATETKVKTKMRTHRNGSATGRPASRAGLTVGQWLTSWLDGGGGGVKPKTLTRYRGLVKYQVMPVLGHHRLADLRAEHLRAALDVWARMPRRTTTGRVLDGTVLSPATVGQAKAVVLKAVSDAYNDGVIAEDYLRGRVRRRTVRHVSPGRSLGLDSARRVMLAVRDSDSPARWHLAFTTALRQSEVLGLRWEDVDLDAAVVHVRSQLHVEPWQHGCTPTARRSTYSKECPTACTGDPATGCTHARRRLAGRPCPEPPDHAACPPSGPCTYTARACPDRVGGGPRLEPSRKSDRDLVVPIALATVTELRSWRAVQDAERAAAGDAWRGRGELATLVFTGICGTPINPRADAKRWKQLLVAAGVPDARLHDARHTASNILQDLGYPRDLVQDLLGQSSVVTTAMYTERSVARLRPAVERLDQVLQVLEPDDPTE